MRTRNAHEEGASALEFVLTMPLLLLGLMISVQFALVAHAQNAAQAAAEEGAARARAYNGSVSAGESRADKYLTRLAGTMFSSHSVAGNRTGTTASVTVSGAVKTMVPGFNIHVSRTSTGPVERFVKEGS